MTMTGTNHDILLYDGVCSLCSGLVQFVLPRDTENRFRFAALQSDFSRQILQKYNLNPDDLNTVYAVLNYGTSEEQVLNKSKAALYVLSHLKTGWSFLSAFGCLPKALTDLGYDLVAKNRYRVFGKHDHCMMPDPAYKDRFIDATPVEQTT